MNTTTDLSGYGAQVIEENGRFALTFWPYCTNCQSPFQFDAEEPFAYCSCGTTEWGDPRPASWVCPPRQPAAQHADDVTVDALRLAAKSAAPYSTAMMGASHLNEVADTIDNLRTQLAEAQRDSERLKNDAAIFYEAAAGLLATNDTLRAELAEAQDALQAAQRLFKEALPKFNWGASFLDANAIQLLNEVPAKVNAAIRAAKEEKNGT